jgi:hypothetical protein
MPFKAGPLQYVPSYTTVPASAGSTSHAQFFLELPTITALNYVQLFPHQQILVLSRFFLSLMNINCHREPY